MTLEPPEDSPTEYQNWSQERKSYHRWLAEKGDNMKITDVTDDDRVRCMERELALRRRLYPRFVQTGKMTQEKADHEIAVMESILNIMKNLRRVNERDLFDV